MILAPIGDGKLTAIIQPDATDFIFRISYSAIDHSVIHTSYSELLKVHLYTSCDPVLQVTSWQGDTEVTGTLGDRVTVGNSAGSQYFSSMNDTFCSITKF